MLPATTACIGCHSAARPTDTLTAIFLRVGAPRRARSGERLVRELGFLRPFILLFSHSVVVVTWLDIPPTQSLTLRLETQSRLGSPGCGAA